MKEVDRLLDEAERLYVGSRDARALHTIQRAIRLAPDRAEALILKGRILFQMDRVRGAMRCYEEATRLDPTSGEGFLERARVWYAIPQDYRRALREVRKALARARGDRWVRIEALRLQGHILSALDRDQESVASYRAALRVGPNDPKTYWNIGENFLIGGQPQRALRYFDRALRILEAKRKPDQRDLGFTILSKAEALNALGRPREALRVIDRGLRHVVDGVSREALRALGRRTRRLLHGRTHPLPLRRVPTDENPGRVRALSSRRSVS